MIKFSEIKVGDYLIADNDGDKKQGEVTNLKKKEKYIFILDTTKFINFYPVLYIFITNEDSDST